ncbi:hypothetical protein B0H19DRAFT_1260363 [Mycena capillaripes]|nr:hypothetical protein B0H19DRAFT_1260363 [Mycena capillaripes]
MQKGVLGRFATQEPLVLFKNDPSINSGANADILHPCRSFWRQIIFWEYAYLPYQSAPGIRLCRIPPLLVSSTLPCRRPPITHHSALLSLSGLPASVRVSAAALLPVGSRLQHDTALFLGRVLLAPRSIDDPQVVLITMKSECVPIPPTCFRSTIGHRLRQLYGLYVVE